MTPGEVSLSRRSLLAGLGAASLLGRRALAAEGEAEAAEKPSFTLRNATVLLHTGERRTGQRLRVEGGQIVALGPSTGTEGLDLGGDWIVPGFVDAGCTVGLVEIGLEKATRDDEETSASISPDARVWDGYNPRSALIPVTRVNGITTALVHPNLSGLIPGQAALMRLTGDTVAAATMLAPAALTVDLGRAALGGGTGAPTSRMGVGMMLREWFGNAPAAPEPPKKKGRKEDEDKKESAKPVEVVVREVRAGRLPVLFGAERADDLLRVADFAREYKLKAVILGGSEAHLVAAELAAADLPVLLGPITVQPDSFDHLAASYANAARLHAAGVRFAFRSGASHFARRLPSDVGVATAYGLPYEAAIAGLTAAAGDILGVEGLGTLAEGGPATFFRAKGDPLQPATDITEVWIDGAPQSVETRQRRLYEQFRTLR